MEDSELISAIVPVYNVKPYLERCFNSIANQSYQNLEIILVDDGSTDGSGILCDTLAAKDQRVKVIHKENGGPGSAKNVGLRAAGGSYIALVDSDDWIAPEMYQKMLELMKQYHAQIAVCGIQRVSADGRFSYYNDKVYEEIVYTTLEALNELPLNERISNSLCNKLFRASVLDGLRMNESLFYDDDCFTPQCIGRADTIIYTATPFYSYFQREGSISKKNCTEKIFDWVKSDRMRLEFYCREFPQCEESAAISFIGTCLKVYYYTAGCPTMKEERKQLARELSETIRNYQHLPFTKKQRMKVRLFSFSPALYVYAMRIRGKQ